MHGCGWDSGAARERSSALAASVASRYELGADGVGAARPGARGSRVTASRYALGAEGGGAARPGAYMCPPRNCARCLLGGGGDVEDVVRCALLERLGARRASSSCGGRGWGGTPRGPCCHRLRHTRAEHRYGGSWQEGGARAASPPLQGLAPPARRPRAAGAPWEARARAARVQTAGEDLWWWWWWWCAHQLRITSGRLPLIGGSMDFRLRPRPLEVPSLNRSMMLRRWQSAPLVGRQLARQLSTSLAGVPKITVVGVGGAGGNAVNNMIERGDFPDHIHFVAANTDAQALEVVAHSRIASGWAPR